jgi:hypothetical protein
MELIIDGVIFRLICKLKSDHYKIVCIQSEYLKKKMIFFVYPSNSELGLWRFYTYSNKKLYKGSHIEKYNYTYDYVQCTLIHFQLQFFINSHIDELIEEENSEIRPPITPELDLVISSPERQIHISPFIDFQNIIQCGITIGVPQVGIKNDPYHLVQLFSKKFEELYSIDYSTLNIEFPYSNYFQHIIRIQGKMKSVHLIKNDNAVKLYFLQLKMIKDVHVNMRASLTPEMLHNIDTICSIPIHYMPCFLTTPNVTCNSYGLYNHYIPCGSFICKLFDYSIEPTMQCTEEEVVCGKVTKIYSYIGSRYLNIFPFNKINIPEKLRLLNTAIKRTRQGGKKSRKRRRRY